MIAAMDVQYDPLNTSACAAMVLFEQWTDPTPLLETFRFQTDLAPYVPGEFYRRELPCILPLLEQASREHQLDYVVVDGYVDLDSGRPGMGRHLQHWLGSNVEIVGVAKSEFVGAPANAIYRGQSARPLWVSATSKVREAAHAVLCMHGKHRLPTLLQRVDAVARAAISTAPGIAVG